MVRFEKLYAYRWVIIIALWSGLGVMVLGSLLLLPRHVMFDNIESVEQYAASIEEFPENDSNSWTEPDFTSVYKKLRPSFIKRVLNWFPIARQPWTAEDLLDLLKSVVLVREKAYPTGNIIIKHQLDKDSTFIVLGDLYSAFHSLVRDLRALIELGYMNKNFEIIRSKTYIVCTGNFSIGSAYCLRVMTLLARLLERNQHNVIILQGDNEASTTWQHHTVKDAISLQTEGIKFNRQDSLYSRLFNRFFNTLPLALYIEPICNKSASDAIDIIRISSSTKEKQTFESGNYGDFFVNPTKKSWDTTQTMYPTEGKIHTIATLHGPSVTSIYQMENPGLLLQSLDAGADWIVISSPTETSRITYQAFYDAMVFLHCSGHNNEIHARLLHRDTRLNEPFIWRVEYDLATGACIKFTAPHTTDNVSTKIKRHEHDIEQLNTRLAKLKQSTHELAPKKQSAEIARTKTDKILSIGSIMDLSHSMHDIGKQLKAGLELVIEATNNIGGIHGEKIKFVVLDDEYVPKKSVAAAQTLVKDYAVNILLSPLGTPTTRSYLPLIQEKSLVLAFPCSGAAEFHNDTPRNIINFRKSYSAEARVLAQYAIEQASAKKMIIFYQRDIPCIDSAMAYLESISFKGCTTLTYERQSADFAVHATKIRTLDPDTIILLAIPTAAVELIRQVGIANLIGKRLLCWSTLAGANFQHAAREKGIDVIMSSVVPDPLRSTIPLVKRCREVATRKQIPTDVHVLEGFINATILVDILKHLKGDITMASIMDYAESIKNYDLEGMILSFDATTRELSSTVWLDIGKQEWLSYTI